MENKKRIITLSAVLLSIIIIGTFFIMKNNNNNSAKKNKDNENETFQENKIGNEKFHYVEDFKGEEEWDGTYELFKYDGKIVRIIDEEKPYLREFKSGDNVYDIPNKDMISGNGRWIDDNTFWNVKYDKETEVVMVSSFDNKGKQKDSIELKDFKGNVYEDSYIRVSQMRVTKDYIYLRVGTDAIPMLQIFTKTGELKNSYRNVMSFDVDNKGRCIYTTAPSEDFQVSGLFMIDSETGDEIFENTSCRPSPIRFSEDGNLIYGFNEKIQTFDSNDGILKKTVFEFGKDSTYVLDDYYINDFMVGEDGELYYSLQTDERNNEDVESDDIKLSYYMYTKEEGERPAKEERETVLTLTAPYRNDFMEEAIKRYELKYPKEHIEYDYAYNTYEEFLENSEEYGTKTTLDIISGDFGDIIQTGGSGLYYQNLLRTDVFMDLTDLIERDESYEYLNKNVLNGIKINNTIRALPINYIFYQYELNEDLEKELGLDIDFDNIAWSEVLDFVKIIEEKAPDRHLFTSIVEGISNWDAFSESLLTANMPDLINLETKEVDLNQKWFKDLLIKFKECSQNKNFINSDWEWDRFDNLHGSLLALTMNRNHFYGDQVVYFDQYNRENRSRMIPSIKGEINDNRIGYSIRMYSINERSERKENAWKFLSFLLEEDIQYLASRERTGMPISKKAVDRILGEVSREIPDDIRNRYNKATMENSQKIDYLYSMDYLMLDIVKPIGLYMDGEITLDEALKRAEEKVVIRLNE